MRLLYHKSYNIETANYVCYTENMKNVEYTTITDKNDILPYLQSVSDKKYKDFTKKLIPNISESRILGVRTPILRSLARTLKDTDVSRDYLCALPHTYLEENHLHGFLIENERDFYKAVEKLEAFLPHIDNWATCDCVRPKVLKRDLPALYTYIKRWIKSSHTYTVRYAIGLLNSFYLDSEFDKSHLSLVSKVESDEYYINMMIAWYFATTLTKQYDSTIPYIEDAILPKWTHNKAIQKAIESYRIDDKTKAYLRTLKIK